MADQDLTVRQDSVYMLRWTTPDTQITNSFVDPDGTSKDFPDPDPPKAGATPEQVKITVKKGKDEASAQPDPFRKSRTPPFVAKKTVTMNRARCGATGRIARISEHGLSVVSVTGTQMGVGFELARSSIEPRWCSLSANREGPAMRTS